MATSAEVKKRRLLLPAAAARAGLSGDAGAPGAEDPFGLALQAPHGLPRLCDQPDLEPPKAEALLGSLPALAPAAARGAPSPAELAEVLGFVSVEPPALREQGAAAWPELCREGLDDAPPGGAGGAGPLAGDALAQAPAELDAAALALEGKVVARQGMARRYDWSFEARIFRPPQGLSEMLARILEGAQHQP